MKIAVPMNERDLQAGVYPSFGRAPYFLFYDTAGGAAEWVKNSAADSPGGAGIQAAQSLCDGGAEALITHRCGENAEKVLRGARVAVYRAVEGSAESNIALCAAGKLAPLSEFHAGFHGHGR